MQLFITFKGDQEVEMRKSAFLEFDHIYVCDHASEDLVLVNVVKQFLLFEFENARNDVRSIVRCLTGEQFSSNFWPVWICGHRDEEVDFLIKPCNCHSVLILLLLVSRTANV